MRTFWHLRIPLFLQSSGLVIKKRNIEGGIETMIHASTSAWLLNVLKKENLIIIEETCLVIKKKNCEKSNRKDVLQNIAWNILRAGVLT